MSDLLIKMPLRKNRFIFRFPSDLGIQEWWVSNSVHSDISQNETDIQYTWDKISITLGDPIEPSASQAVMEWVCLHSESVTGR